MCETCKDYASLSGYKQITKEQWENFIDHFRKQFKHNQARHVFYGVPDGFARQSNILAVHCTVTDCRELVPGKSEVDCLVVELCGSELQFYHGSHAYLSCPYTHRYDLFEHCIDNLRYKFDYQSQLTRAALLLMVNLKGLGVLDPIELVAKLVGNYLFSIGYELDEVALDQKMALVREALKKEEA